MSDSNQEVLLKFAEQIGQLTQGLTNLKASFNNHLKEHSIDRVMQWAIIALQTIVIVFLGYLKTTGKI